MFPCRHCSSPGGDSQLTEKSAEVMTKLEPSTTPRVIFPLSVNSYIFHLHCLNCTKNFYLNIIRFIKS